MSLLYVSSAFLAFIFLAAFLIHPKGKLLIQNPYFLIFVIGFTARYFASKLSVVYDTDINCFKSWASMLFTNGMSRFYSSDAFTDYPPGYMYILFFLGFLKNLLGLAYESDMYTFLIKLPAILFDIFTGFLIYKIIKELQVSKGRFSLLALVLSLLYVLNPATILDSAVWGQVDSVYVFFLILSVYLLSKEKYFTAFLTFTVSVIIKPQSLMFSPLYLFAMYRMLRENMENWIRLLQYALVCLALTLLLFLPFTENFQFMPIVNQYVATLSSYAYATVNAYNFYAFLGANWAPIDQNFLFLSYNTWGLIFIILIVVFSFCLLAGTRKKNYFFVAATINVLVFMLSVKMHERYLFPALGFLLLAYAVSRDRKVLLLYGLFSLTLFINTVDILNVFLKEQNYTLITSSMMFVSTINLILSGVLIYVGFRKETPALAGVGTGLYAAGALDSGLDAESDDTPLPEIPFPNQKQGQPFAKLDFILCGALTLVYALVAFTNLGNTKSPQTLWTGNAGKVVLADFGENVHVSKMHFLTGPVNDKNFSVSASFDNLNFTQYVQAASSSAFNWGEQSLNIEARYVKLNINTDNTMLFEVAFFDDDNQLLAIKDFEIENEALFDEQDLVPETPTYMTSSYFDEIYHTRTAYEFIKGFTVYETTHPPLGKIIIAAGIKLFGLTPFGWRFSGTLFGVLMLPLIYLFARAIFVGKDSSFWAFFATFIFAFDFMHYAQTRISTIDTYIVFFVIGMYYFMYLYCCSSFNTEKLSKTLLFLFLSGLFMGMGIASKWPGVYAAGGLAVIFFFTLYKRYREAVELEIDKRIFIRKVAITLVVCILSFVVVPVIIYGLSYIPYINSMAQKPITLQSAFKTILDSQTLMFNYHAHLESTHPYSSTWWEWPLMLRPIFYYAKYFESNVRAGISSFGNPAVWWMGIVAFFYVVRSLSKRFDHTLLFFVVAFFAQYLPWLLISRTTYIYHYFPSVPFLVLMVAYFFKDYVMPRSRRLVFFYLAIVLLLFIVFYPVLTGIPVNLNYVTYILRWFRTWQLA